jgi:hydroxymethylbilane synthase
MQSVIKIGTRESELAVWQATTVKELLQNNGFASELVYIKSEGDIDLKTPLYQMGVQGIFTRSLDIALLNNKIDIAVHSMKDVPTQLAEGIVQAAVLKRGNYKDLFVVNYQWSKVNSENEAQLTQHNIFLNSLKLSDFPSSAFDGLPTDDLITIATSSIRRKAQWLHRYPQSAIENIRGNVNTRLQKLHNSSWQGAIFAAAGLERINKRPANAIELDWMLPAPAQGAVMVAARKADKNIVASCETLNDVDTAICTKIERDFLKELLGGCSTPISALAEIKENEIHFQGNILSLDGTQKASVEKTTTLNDVESFGILMAQQLLATGGNEIAKSIRDGK